MTLKEIENVIQKSTLEILEIPNNKANANRVRISWTLDGAPDWKINENVVFIRVYQADGQYNRPKDVQYQNNDPTSLIRKEIYTRIIAVDWIFYGPSGFDDADIIRNGLNKNETLTKNNLFLILDRAAPTRTPELFNGQWWERSNFTAYFNEQVTREYTVPTIGGATITVKTEGGDIFNGNITS